VRRLAGIPYVKLDMVRPVERQEIAGDGDGMFS
jgi:hypothetical protein